MFLLRHASIIIFTTQKAKTVMNENTKPNERILFFKLKMKMFFIISSKLYNQNCSFAKSEATMKIILIKPNPIQLLHTHQVKDHFHSNRKSMLFFRHKRELFHNRCPYMLGKSLFFHILLKLQSIYCCH